MANLYDALPGAQAQQMDPNMLRPKLPQAGPTQAPQPAGGGNLAGAIGGGGNLAGALGSPGAPPAPAGRVQGPGLTATPQAPPAQPAPAGQPLAPTATGQTPVAGVTLPNGQWVPSDHPLAGGAQPGAGAAGGAAGGPPAPPSMTDAFRTALTQRLQATQMPTSVNDDPVLAAQSGAFRQANARQAARDRSSAMEAAGAQGLESSGGTSSILRKLDADRSFREGQADAQLLGGARDQRMGELFQALGLAGQYDQSDRRLNLDAELGRSGQDIQRQGLSAQTELGRGDLDLRNRLGTRGQDLELMNMLMGDRYRNTALGVNTGLAEQGINTDALVRLMQMGG
jgi:hypothetical protein